MLMPVVDVFVDGGGNSRLTVDRCLGQFPPFHKVYVFEPNPLFHDSYEGSGFHLVKKAIWTSNSTLPFFLSKDDRQIASSLLEEKLCKVDSQIVPYWHDQPIQVECVDFSQWLKDNIKPYHNLTLKLDIEGAEYDVLWKLIQDGTINCIKSLFVEFHLDTVQSKREQHDQLVAALRAKGVEPHNWD